MIGFIAAMTSDLTIAVNGEIPWHSPEDMYRFKQVTFGSTVIMGRKTWETLPGPLVGRTNVVVTRTQQEPVGTTQFVSLYEAIKIANGAPRAWVIGGAELFRSFYELQPPDVLDITWISGTYALVPRQFKTTFPLSRKEINDSYRMKSFVRGKEVLGFQEMERK